jgi:DNA (cytosine-5)-methyltransferase 3A
MNVLSLFDGISCGQLALQRAGIKVDNYFASEIKKHAIKLTQHHFPNTIQLGDVTKLKGSDLPKIDLLIGGSPCQDFSPLKWINWESKGLEGDKSALFYEYLRLLKEVKPRYFLLENVKMKKESEMQLNNFLGIKGVHINSNLVSYQNRPRIYWTNIPGYELDLFGSMITQPEDRHINFQDYKDTEPEYCRQFKVNRTPSRERMWNDGNGRNQNGACANVTDKEKVYCITRKQDRFPNSGLIECDDFCRYLTRHEIEQAQTLPKGYTDILTYGQMQDVCGDGWTVDVIAHIFKGLKGANND